MKVDRFNWHEDGHEPDEDGGWVLFNEHEKAVEEARNEPQPGQMHPVDKAFYDTAVAERNKACHDLETLEKRIAKALEFSEDGDIKAMIFQLKGEKR